jgi:hypothetical protein
MGCFLAGLTFCSSDGLHHLFARQFKRILQWLMRVFFSASIGFQVPIKDFGDMTVIVQGLIFCLALIGKIAVGFMVPNFSQSRRFTANHLRDCLVTGFSMAAEGEFAFVIAVFAVDAGLINKVLYASVVLAVLISTIIPPFCLRFTISYYNRKGEQAVAKAAEEEELRRHDLDTSAADVTLTKSEEDVLDGIKNGSDVFLVIQTQSESSWGPLIKIMNMMGKKGLDVIDHRSWSPRGINTTLVNEVYARVSLKIGPNQSFQETLDALIEDIKISIEGVIAQPNSGKVKVQRWYPGVVEEIFEEVDEIHDRNASVRQRLLSEAAENLERKQKIQTEATKAKSVAELLDEVPETALPVDFETGNGHGTEIPTSPSQLRVPKPRRRVRRKVRSTPVVGGSLFGESSEALFDSEKLHRADVSTNHRREYQAWSNVKAAGVPAQITVNGEVYSFRISLNAWQNLKKGLSNLTDSRGVPLSGIEISALDDAPVSQRLHGFVRHMPLGQTDEEELDGVSEVSENSTIEVASPLSPEQNRV